MSQKYFKLIMLKNKVLVIWFVRASVSVWGIANGFYWVALKYPTSTEKRTGFSAICVLLN